MASLWTRTPHFRLHRGALIVATLSVALADRALGRIEFVTDSFGANLASLFGWPFARISTPLDELDGERGLHHVWALGKLVANTLQTQPFVQFDLDVLLKNPLPERLLNAPLVAQSPDHPSFYASSDMRKAFGISRLPAGQVAYNAGLVGGSDLDAVRAYSHAAISLARRFNGCGINGTTTSMVIEQYWLGVFANATGTPVETLLPLLPTKEQANAVGYCHLVGGAKHDPRNVQKAEEKLAAEFPALHARFQAAWAYLSATADPRLFQTPGPRSS